MIATRKLRPPIKRHGGKAYLASRIVALMPEHRVYNEPFVGGGSCLLNKPKTEREFAGDLDGDLVNMWQILAARPGLILDVLARIPYEEEQFRFALTESAKLNAVSYIVRNRFSRGGLGKTFAWSDRLRGGQPGDANAWDTIRAEFPAIAERVRDVEFRCQPALDAIRLLDGPETLHYLDPPYCASTRTARKAYQHEMTTVDHQSLLGLAFDCQGMVILSGYRSALYDDALVDWRRVEIDMPNHSGQGATKQRRVECLWLNPACGKAEGVAR